MAEVNVTPRTPVRLLGQDADGVFPVTDSAARALLYPDGLAGEVATAAYAASGRGEALRSGAERAGDRASLFDWLADQADRAACKAGTNTDDLASVFQAAIDQLATASGQSLYESILDVPGGLYYSSQLTAKSHVGLRGAAAPGRSGGQDRSRIRLPTGGSDASQFTSSGTVIGFSVDGFYLIGRGAAVDHHCVDLAGLTSGYIGKCRIENYGGSAVRIGAGVASSFEHLYTPNCGGVAQAALRGVLDIAGTDHWLDAMEISGGVGGVGSGSAVSGGSFNACIVLRGDGFMVKRLVAEFGEVGFHLIGGGHLVVACRADNCVGTGFRVASTSKENSLAACRSHRNGHGTNNTFYGFHLSGLSTSLVGCRNTGLPDASRVKYGFYDDSSAGFDGLANTLDSTCVSTDHVTQGVYSQNGGRRLAYSPAIQKTVAVVGSAQTVDADQCKAIELTAAAAASVAGFSKLATGQEFTLTFGDSNTTLTHSASLALPGAVDFVGSTLKRLTCSVRGTQTSPVLVCS